MALASDSVNTLFACLAKAMGNLPRRTEALPDGYRPAAVLVLLVERNQTFFVPLMERTEAGGPHSGQISFPGGSREPTDESDVETALREASEEFGIQRSQVEVLGVMDDEVTPTGYLVTPVVAAAKSPLHIVPDPAEVESVFEVPLSFLVDRANEIEHTPVSYQGRIYSLYEYRLGKHVIWGLTARILHRLVEIIATSGCSSSRPSINASGSNQAGTDPAGQTEQSIRNERMAGPMNPGEDHMDEFERIEQAAAAVRAALGPAFHSPSVGMILGSGLGAFADRIEDSRTINYADIPHFSESTVPGHAGKMVFGRLSGLDVVVLQGRVHYYEGHELEAVVRPVRTLIRLGAQRLIITNAAGSVRPEIGPGELVVLSDHINLLGHHPLRGPNDERLGPRFPDMSQAYDPKLRDLARRAASDLGWTIREGVYAAMMGPSYETPAEVAMVGRLGGDLVGMSTVPEVIVARHMDLPVFAVSVISDLGVDGRIIEISHEEVMAAVEQVTPKLVKIIKGLIADI